MDCIHQRKINSIDCSKYFGSDHLKFKRHKKFNCRSKRIRILAQPKYLIAKYIKPEDKCIDKSIEIIKGDNLSTRIKMISLPKVRKLVASYECYKNIASPDKLTNINNLIQNSIMTMYSRLANVHLKYENSKIHRRKWTKSEWQKHCEWLKKRSRPKNIPEIQRVAPKIIPIKKLKESICKLSKPRFPRKKYHKTFGYQSTVKNVYTQYVPTTRITELSEPKTKVEKVEEKESINDQFHVNPEALTYVASKFKFDY